MQNPVIRKLQASTNQLRFDAHKTNDPIMWQNFRNDKKRLKYKIRAAKKLFFKHALSKNNPKETWKVIHNILNPPSKPFQFDINETNKFFASTAERTLHTTAKPMSELLDIVNNL